MAHGRPSMWTIPRWSQLRQVFKYLKWEGKKSRFTSILVFFNNYDTMKVENDQNNKKQNSKLASIALLIVNAQILEYR